MHYVDVSTRLFWGTHLFHLQLMSYHFDVRKRTQIVVLKCLVETCGVNFQSNYFHLIYLNIQNYVYFSKLTSFILYSTLDTHFFFTHRIIEFPLKFYNVRNICRYHTKKTSFQIWS